MTTWSASFNSIFILPDPSDYNRASLTKGHALAVVVIYIRFVSLQSWCNHTTTDLFDTFAVVQNDVPGVSYHRSRHIDVDIYFFTNTVDAIQFARIYLFLVSVYVAKTRPGKNMRGGDTLAFGAVVLETLRCWEWWTMHRVGKVTVPALLQKNILPRECTIKGTARSRC